jgi:outer membrane receptor protein involved in Fe transport
VAPTPPDGGCLYNRPDDRNDDFFNAAPNIGLLYRFNESTVSFTNIARGFRVPQATELYRLQAQQSISDIDSETIDSIETGIRHETPGFSIEAVTYYMKKRDFIFRDSEGINVSDGKTEHYGVETSFNWWLIDQVYLNAVGSWSNQEYAFSRDAGLGEQIEDGNDIDTTPQILASARLGWEYGMGVAELEWVYNDEYYLDAANTAKYEGHDLYNFRLTFVPTENWDFALRVNNLTDTEYADRADLFSITDEYRYFPGRDREVFVQATWRN